MISGGFAGGGESSSARKAHLRSIRSAELGEVQSVSKIPRVDTTITFSDSDMEGCQPGANLGRAPLLSNDDIKVSHS